MMKGRRITMKLTSELRNLKHHDEMKVRMPISRLSWDKADNSKDDNIGKAFKKSSYFKDLLEGDEKVESYLRMKDDAEEILLQAPTERSEIKWARIWMGASLRKHIEQLVQIEAVQAPKTLRAHWDILDRYIISETGQSTARTQLIEMRQKHDETLSAWTVRINRQLRRCG